MKYLLFPRYHDKTFPYDNHHGIMTILKMGKERLRELEILMLHKQETIQLKVPNLYSYDQLVEEAVKQVYMKMLHT